MFIYFKSIQAVLICHEYPYVLTVEKMKLEKLEHMCNKWEQHVSEDGTFTLSYKHDKLVFECDCDHSQDIHVFGYDNSMCFNCNRPKKTHFKDGERLYLQNSGSIDIVCVKPTNHFCQLCEVDGYPNVYKWTSDSFEYDKLIFALHVKDGMLSDENISDNIDSIQEQCHILFTECI